MPRLHLLQDEMMLGIIICRILHFVAAFFLLPIFFALLLFPQSLSLSLSPTQVSLILSTHDPRTQSAEHHDVDDDEDDDDVCALSLSFSHSLFPNRMKVTGDGFTLRTFSCFNHQQQHDWEMERAVRKSGTSLSLSPAHRLFFHTKT